MLSLLLLHLLKRLVTLLILSAQLSQLRNELLGTISSFAVKVTAMPSDSSHEHTCRARSSDPRQSPLQYHECKVCAQCV